MKNSDIHIGDIGGDIIGASVSGSNSNIIGKSIVVSGSLYDAKRHDDQIRKALEMIAEFIKKSNNPAATVLFDNFSEELNKPQPEISRLRSLWSGLETVLPSIASISETVGKIKKLFN